MIERFDFLIAPFRWDPVDCGLQCDTCPRPSRPHKYQFPRPRFTVSSFLVVAFPAQLDAVNMMLRSVVMRRLCSTTILRRRHFPSLLFSTDASPQPVSPPPQPHFHSNTLPPPPLQPSQPSEQQQDPAASAAPEAATATATAAEEEIRRKRSSRARAGEYEDEQARVLRAALNHVVKLGWSESAMILGARDVGVSPSIIGSFPRKEAALVEFFMDDSLQRLIDRIDSGEELKGLMLSERLSKLIRMRLEMQEPYISKWPQALSIQAQPTNFPTSFKQRALLIDEIWHAVGDQASDFDWYVKRTVLGGIYSTTEVFMLTDHSPEFRDTWAFLDRRIRDAFDVQKTLQEAAYLAEAVGAGVGKSMEGFMKKLFQGGS